MSARRVFVVPLAAKGYLPIDPDHNPVRWYFEDANTGSIIALDSAGYATIPEAELAARQAGWEVAR